MDAGQNQGGTVGVVAIGRNEGERLRRCIGAVRRQELPMVYVDSASTDDSVAFARSRGVEVVELDLSRPFTAARARNAGVRRLSAGEPRLEFVQLVDGDCELAEGWLEKARQRLSEDRSLAVVCGRLRERFPETSPYNRLCDLEWDTPVGETDVCGGIAMVRLAAFQQVQGFDESLIAGEEPELCLRLRELGWRIERLDAEMALHDAQMTELRQWWRRNVRAGHAFAEVYWLHRRSPQAIWGRQVRSILVWGALLPLGVAALSALWRRAPWALAAYPWLWARVRRQRLARGDSPEEASLYAASCVLGKFPLLVGVATYGVNRLRRRRTGLIEHK